MARPTRDDVRAALLDAAYVEFAEHGYQAATVEAIAHRAGFTKGAVYGNFEGKFGLLLGLLEPEWMDRAKFLEGLGGEPGDPEASMTLVAQGLHRLSQNVLPTLVVAEARGHAARVPDLAARFAQTRVALFDAMAPRFEAELRRVGLEPVAPMREVLYVLIGLVSGIAMEQVGIEEPVVPVELVDRVLRSLVVVTPGR